MDYKRLEVNEKDVIVVYVGVFDLHKDDIDAYVAKRKADIETCFPGNKVLALPTRENNAKGIEFLILGRGPTAPAGGGKCLCG